MQGPGLRLDIGIIVLFDVAKRLVIAVIWLNLHQQFVSRQGREYLVEGDAKLYELRYSSMGITFPSTIQGVHSDYGLQGRKMEILDTVCFCGCHGLCQSIFCYPQWGLAPEGK